MYTHFIIKPFQALALCLGLLGLSLATLAIAETEPLTQAIPLELQQADQADFLAQTSADLSLLEGEQVDQADIEVAPDMPQLISPDPAIQAPESSKVSQGMVSAAEEKPKPKPSEPNVKPSSQNPWEELSNWFKQYQRS